MKRRIVLEFISIIMVFPLLIMFGNSFMGVQELEEAYGAVFGTGNGEVSMRLIPEYPTLRPYVELLLDSPDFFVMFWNSCKQVFPILIGQTVIGMPAAWAFARYRFKGRRVLFMVYMILMVMPFQVTMVSNYLVLSKLSLMDTHFALDRKSVEGMRMAPGQAALMASRLTRNRSRSWVGVPSSQRTWTWRTAAPAS